MADVRHRLITEGELHNPKGFTSSGDYTEAIRDENGVARYKKSKFLEDSLNFVDGNAAPPTEVLGAIYVLIDDGNGAVNAGWDGVNYNEWCRFNGVEWVGFAPTEGVICYDATANFHKIFNGTSWLRLIPIAENISNANLTWAGDTTQYLNGNTLIFTDGVVIKKGEDNLAESSNLKLQNSSSTDLLDFRNNGDVHQGDDITHFLHSKIFTFNLGTVGTITNLMGVKLDASLVTFTGSNSQRVLEMTNSVGSAFGVYSSGFLENISDLNNSIATFRNRTNTKGLQVDGNQTILSSETFQFRNSFSNSSDTITTEVDNNFTQLYMTTNGVINHWLRTNDGAAQASFFIDGIKGRGFNVGAGLSVLNEDISLQGDTYIGGELIQHAPTTAIPNVNLSNDSFAFHIDSGSLKGRYKDNLGVVADLVIGGSLAVDEGSATITEANWSGNTNYAYSIAISGAIKGDSFAVYLDDDVFSNIKTAAAEDNSYAYCNVDGTVEVVGRVTSFISIPASSTIKVKNIK